MSPLIRSVGLRRGERFTPAFTPADLLGLYAWFDASDAATITQASGVVSAWADKSGNNRDASQATSASRPTYQATGLNGKPTIRFDGENDFMTVANMGHLTTLTVAAVVKPTNNSGFHAIIGRTEAGPNFRHNWVAGLDGGQHLLLYNNGSAYPRVQATAVTPANVAHALIGRLSSTPEADLHWDGALQALALDTVAGSPVNFGTAVLGASDAGTSFFWAGDISEVVVTSDAVSDADLTKLSHYLMRKWGIADRPDILLDVPTYDGNPNVGHADLVHVPSGFDGYEHLLFFTPFPNDPRENPSLLATNDFVTWAQPASNPIAPLADAVADGFTAQSDSDAVLLGDGTIALYYRPHDSGGGSKEAIYRRVSGEGDLSTWAARESAGLSNNTSPNDRILSPAIVLDGGVFRMWSVNATANPNQVEYRESATGVGDWTSPVAVSLPALLDGGQPWHVEVVKTDDDKYHMLLCAVVTVNQLYRLYYFQSDDGETWAGTGKFAVPLQGGTRDGRGHYRSALGKHHGGGKFDVVLTMIDTSGSDVWSAQWRFGLLRRFDLGAA